MRLKKNLGSFYLLVAKSEAKSLVSSLCDLLERQDDFKTFVYLEGKNRFKKINFCKSFSEDDFFDEKNLEIKFSFSKDTIELAIFKIESFLKDGFFSYPELCECIAKNKTVQLILDEYNGEES